jgi:hypothetical protein
MFVKGLGKIKIKKLNKKKHHGFADTGKLGAFDVRQGFR